MLGLERSPNSPGEDWVDETGNVTLAVMTPYTHDYEFTPLPPGTIAFRVPDVAEVKAKLEAAGGALFFYPAPIAGTLVVTEQWGERPAGEWLPRLPDLAAGTSSA